MAQWVSLGGRLAHTLNAALTQRNFNPKLTS